MPLASPVPVWVHAAGDDRGGAVVVGVVGLAAGLAQRAADRAAVLGLGVRVVASVRVAPGVRPGGAAAAGGPARAAAARTETFDESGCSSQ